MSEQQDRFRRLIELVAQMPADGPTPEQADTLGRLLDDPACRRLYIELVGLQSHLETALSPGTSVADGDEDHNQMLGALLDAESSAEVDTITFSLNKQPGEEDHGPTPAHELAAFGGYLVRRLLTARRLAYGAAAAVILAGAVLLIVVLGSGPGPGAPAPGGLVVDPAPRASDRAIAWVTDQVHARWESGGDPVPMPEGAGLRAWERLTLTHGFAEITTTRGAKALLQAPCTIETTDHPNALRLHRGRLVGKCLTATSKGFTVYAPGMDVVDLGTEFGIEADEQAGSTVVVMSGSVRAEPTPASPQAFEPVVLTESEARQVVPETGGLQAVTVDEAPAFYREKPHPYVAAVLNAAPVAYWRFEEKRGGEVPNEVGPGENHLDAFGPVGLTDAGVIGRAARLANRAAPYGFFETAKPVEALSGLDGYTVELWYYTDERYTVAAKNSTASLMVWYDPLRQSEDPDDNVPLMIELLNDFWIGKEGQEGYPPGWRQDSIRVYPGFIGDTEPKRQLFTREDYPVRRWQHLVLVNEGDTVLLYLDGRLAEALPGSLDTVGAPMVRLGQSIIGLFEGPEHQANEGDHRSLRGRLDEVAIYDRPLRAEEVAKHYALANGGAP